MNTLFVGEWKGVLACLNRRKVRFLGEPRARWALALILLARAWWGAPAAMGGQNAEFDYELSKDKTAITITHYRGTNAAVTIPDMVDGLPVTTVNADSFLGNTNVTSVSIGPKVSTLGLLESYTSYQYPPMTAIEVAEANPYYRSVDGVVFDKNLKTLRQYPRGKAGNYRIPDGVESIDFAAFQCCYHLTGVDAPNSLLQIGSCAFNYCSSLTNINLPESMLEIGYSAFMYCGNLKRMAFPRGLTQITACTLCGCSNLQEVVIPRGVTMIGSAAFMSCGQLTRIIIPDTVTFFQVGVVNGGTAFNDCTNLESILFLGNAPKADFFYVYGADKAKAYYLPGATGWTSQLGTLPTALWPNPTPFSFGGDDGGIRITGYTGPGGAVEVPETIADLPVAGISERAFYGNTNIQSLTLPSSLQHIDSEAFAQCAQLASVRVGSNVTTLGARVFAACPALAQIQVDSNNLSFRNLDGVLFDAAVHQLIQYPAALPATSYALPAGVTAVSDMAFAKANNLTNVVLPNSVLSLGNGAFQGCASLRRVKLANSVETIGAQAFADCPQLAGLYFEGNAPQVAPNVGSNSPQATAYYLAGMAGWSAEFAGLPTAEWQEAWPFTYVATNNDVTITGYTPSGYAATIPSTIDGLPVTTVGAAVFAHCPDLGKVNLPESITNIEAGALAYCDGLAEMNLPNGLRHLGNGALAGCAQLTQVTIPASVASLGDGVFGSCARLASVSFLGDAPEISSGQFAPNTSVTVFYLPQNHGWGTAFGGRAATAWKPKLARTPANLATAPGQFSCDISWASGQTVIVETCTNLAQPVWLPVATNVITAGRATFSDLAQTNKGAHFYRVRVP